MVDRMSKGWFSEVSEAMWPGQAMSLEYTEVLEDCQSEFQHVQILQTKTYGKMLVLDGVIQVTERDEHAYQEMIAHLPLFAHPNPRNVLIIGGGDGGVLREVLRHPCVESVTQCDIDGKVIDLCKKHLPQLSCSFDDPRLNLVIGDGFKFMREHEAQFDVIITDSSDPVGPANTLFELPYYELMKRALKEDGLLSAQGECMWLHLDLIREMQDFCRTIYEVVDYAYTTIPTYPSGQIGFCLCSKNPATSFREPARILTEEDAETMGLKYYSAEVHRAAFVLPRFAQKKIHGGRP